MIKKTFVPLLGALALLASCAENDIVDKGFVLSSDQISFGTYMGPSSRATAVETLEALKSKNFKVFAAYTGNATWAGAIDKTPNFMYNDPVTWDGTAASGAGAWAYAGAKYWPQSGNVTFYAYSPNLSTHVEHSLATSAAAPSFAYEVQNGVSDQEDLLADLVVDQTKANGTVRFNFDHLLSKIGFAAKLNAEYTGATVKVTKMQITYGASAIKNKATYTYADDNTVVGIWSDFQTSTLSGSNDLQPVDGVTLSTNASALNATDKFLMLLPQATDEGALKARIEYEVSYTDGVKNENVATIDLPACTWAPGKQYTYNFNISLNAVTFDVIAINPWEEGTTVALADEEGTPITATSNIPAVFTAAAGSESNQTTFTVTGATSMDPVSSTNFNVDFTPTSSRAAASGTLTIKPKAANSTGAEINETISATFTDELNNKKTFSFNAKQFALLSLKLNGQAVITGTHTIAFKSDASAYQFDATDASGFAFTVEGAVEEGVSVSMSGSDFTVNSTNSGITFTANSPLTLGSDNKTTTATITLTGSGTGNTQSYTINLTQYALAAMKINSTAIAAGAVPVINFKSTQAVADGSNASAQFINTTTTSGSFASNDDFTVTTNTSGISATANNSLAAAGNTDKELSGNLVLTNACGETTTYTMSAKQYAAAYITRNSSIIGNNRYAYKTGTDVINKEFNVSNTNGIISFGDWVNGNKGGTASGNVKNIQELMYAPSFDNATKKLTVSNNGERLMLANTDQWREGSIVITVQNELGEVSSYTLLVKRIGPTGSTSGTVD